jgi:hypothetical protein
MRFTYYTAVAAAVLMGVALVCHAPTAHAQTVTGDALATVMLGEADLPGFALAADGSPAVAPDDVRDQRTRVFTALDGSGMLLTLILSVPHSDAVCLPRVRATIASGDVLSALNDAKPNFQSLGPLGVGDVDAAAMWSDFDGGRAAWYTVSEEVFMRGAVTVYVEAIAYDSPPDANQLAEWAQRQDAKLLVAAADPASAVGALARTVVPDSPAGDPTVCGQP